jgi:hypothetical protein
LSQVTDRNVHFVLVDYPKVPQDDYLPSRLSANDYPNLVAEGKSVDTVAAEAVLATYNWPSNTDRYRSLLVDSLFSKIEQLQRPPFHPKWKEMTPRVRPSASALMSRACSSIGLKPPRHIHCCIGGRLPAEGRWVRRPCEIRPARAPAGERRCAGGPFPWPADARSAW